MAAHVHVRVGDDVLQGGQGLVVLPSTWKGLRWSGMASRRSATAGALPGGGSWGPAAELPAKSPEAVLSAGSAGVRGSVTSLIMGEFYPRGREQATIRRAHVGNPVSWRYCMP